MLYIWRRVYHNVNNDGGIVAKLFILKKLYGEVC